MSPVNHKPLEMVPIALHYVSGYFHGYINRGCHSGSRCILSIVHNVKVEYIDPNRTTLFLFVCLITNFIVITKL